jgi:hypothetical protein
VDEIVRDETVAELPSPVQRCLRRSGVIGLRVPERITVRQQGEILLRDRWTRFTASESYTVDPPGFEWNASVKVAGLPLARAEDSLAGARGRMFVRLLGMITVVDESGPEMDQGSLMRWLNETMWFPHVWATDSISWSPVDERSAVGSLSLGDLTVEAEFRFDDDGRLVDFRADRYRIDDEGASLAPWSTPLKEHARFDGVEVPSHGSAVWAPDGEALEYIRIRVTGVRHH